MFVSALFVQAVLAAAAFALPSGVVKRNTTTTLVPIPVGIPTPNKTNAAESTRVVVNTSNIAGAGLFGPEGDFTAVTGEFDLPLAQRPADGSFSSRAIPFIALDVDDGCPASFVGGVQTIVVGEDVFYAPFYQWGNEVIDVFQEIQLNAGDHVRFLLTTTNTTHGTATVVKNGGQFQNVRLAFPQAPLCRASAGWFVGAAATEPLANFGEIVYEEARALERGQSVGPTDSRAFIFNIVQDDTVLVEATPGEGEFELHVKYTQ